jgi:hypothetical protein
MASPWSFWSGWESNDSGTESTSKLNTETGDLNTLTRAEGQATDYPHMNVTTNIEGDVTNAHYSYGSGGNAIGTQSGEWTTDGTSSEQPVP